MKVTVTQSCPTLCDPMDYRANGILQARILKWVAFPFFRASPQPRDRSHVSHLAGRWILLNLKLKLLSDHFSLLMAVDQHTKKGVLYIGGWEASWPSLPCRDMSGWYIMRIGKSMSELRGFIRISFGAFCPVTMVNGISIKELVISS